MRVLITLAALFFGFESFAMESESIKVVLYRKAETIFGEEFLPANEAVVDYLATLPRPTEAFQGFVYRCNVKGQSIRPSVNPINAGQTQTYVTVTTVYEIKDCVREG